MNGALDLLDEAIERLRGVDLEALDAAELHDVIRGLAAASVRIEAQMVRAVARWDAASAWADDDSKSPVARLARETHLPKPQARKLVSRGRRLRTMPHTADAYAAGAINGAHVDVIATCDQGWANTTFAESEQFLIDSCTTAWFENAVTAIRYWQMYADRDVADPATNVDKVERDRESNRVSASRLLDGKLAIDGVLDTIGGEIFRTELDRLTEQLRAADRRDGVDLTPGQRRAAALVEMATRSATMPAGGQRPRPLITVTMGVEHFQWMCQTAAGTVLEPGLVVPLLSDAEVERIVHDPPNRRLEASHRAGFTGAIRRIIGLRDRNCQHVSGCDEPAHRCDVDHVEPRACGGITCICNGQLLCTFHNRIVKAEHDRRRALQHRVERDAERHRTGCLLAHPEPAEHEVDTADDEGDWRLSRIPDPDDARGWVTLGEYRSREVA